MKTETILYDDIHYIGEDVFQHIKRYTVQGGNTSIKLRQFLFDLCHDICP